MSKKLYSGIGLIEFTRRVFTSGNISLTGVLRLPLYYIQLIPALPLSWLQRLLFGHKIESTTIKHDPIFILGHFRSGTTYLQKLLAGTQQFAYLTNYDCLFPNSNLLMGGRIKRILQALINVLKIKNPFFNNNIVDLDDPGEEDDYLVNKASAYTSYWGLVFPRKWSEWLSGQGQFHSTAYQAGWKEEYLRTLRYISWRSGGKQLVLKSPPNTERIHMLLGLFPNAKFIYLYRNPYHVFFSMRNMWRSAILKNYSLQNISTQELHETIFNYYELVSESYHRDKHLIPNGNLFEVSYEILKADPYLIVKRMYESLSIPGFQACSDVLLKRVDIEARYQTFSHDFDQDLVQEIGNRWKDHITKGGYNPAVGVK